MPRRAIAKLTESGDTNGSWLRSRRLGLGSLASAFARTSVCLKTADTPKMNGFLVVFQFFKPTEEPQVSPGGISNNRATPWNIWNLGSPEPSLKAGPMDQIRKFRRPISGAGRQLLPLLGGLSRHLEGYGAGDSRTEPARERFEKREAQQRHASIKGANRDAKSPVPLVFILFGSSLQSQRPRKGVV